MITRIGALVILSLSASVMSRGQTLIVNDSLTINSDTSFTSVIVTSTGRLTMNGLLTVNGNMQIDSGGLVTHSERHLAGLRLSIADTLEVKAMGFINVSGKGLKGGNNGSVFGSSGEAIDSLGAIVAGATPAAGASYGGSGNSQPGASTNLPYGLLEDPAYLGSGGGGDQDSVHVAPGGNGGGRITINAGTCIIDGGIIANGGSSVLTFFPSFPGSGSGGSIKLTVQTFTGTGSIVASGAPGGGTFAPGGGGGRIAIFYSTPLSATSTLLVLPTIVAVVGMNVTPGSSGIVYLSNTSQQTKDILVGNPLSPAGGSLPTPILTNLYTFSGLLVGFNTRPTTIGNLRVANTTSVVGRLSLRSSDTLFVSRPDTSALVGQGIVVAGTIHRAIQQNQPGRYTFESESTYVRFYGTGTYPSSVTVTTYPDATPSTLGSEWRLAGGTVNTLTHTIRIDSVHPYGRWTIRVPHGTEAPTTRLVDSTFVRRVYSISAQGDTSAFVRLSLRYEPSELPPGAQEDSLQLYYFDPSTINVSIAQGWNLISNPVTNPTPGDSVRQLFPTSLNAFAFEFDNGYVQKYRLANGKGYWGKFPGAISNSITGTARTRDSVNVVAGWNIVGSITNTVDTNTIVSIPTGLRTSNWFEYSGGYLAATQLVPGKGYWVKSTGAGKFVLANPPVAKSQGSGVGLAYVLNSLTITDSRGSLLTLYFGADPQKQIPVAMYALPPVPPVGAFDARFETADGGSMVQTHGAELSSPVEFAVSVQSEAYPLTINWKVTNASYALSDATGNVTNMTGEGSVKITNSSANRFLVKLLGEGGLPKDFALSQNYPNPFNPTTIIRYALPTGSHVTLRIYDILGQEVKTLVNEVQKSGFMSVRWDATNNRADQLGSGVYFYQLQATSIGDQSRGFLQVRKMLLLR